MGQQHAAMSCRPIQDYGILFAGKTDVLDAHDIEVRIPEPETSKDRVVEVLVCQQTEHGGSALSVAAPREEALAETD